MCYIGDKEIFLIHRICFAADVSTDVKVQAVIRTMSQDDFSTSFEQLAEGYSTYTGAPLKLSEQFSDLIREYLHELGTDGSPNGDTTNIYCFAIRSGTFCNKGSDWNTIHNPVYLPGFPSVPVFRHLCHVGDKKLPFLASLLWLLLLIIS